MLVDGGGSITFSGKDVIDFDTQKTTVVTVIANDPVKIKKITVKGDGVTYTAPGGDEHKQTSTITFTKPAVATVNVEYEYPDDTPSSEIPPTEAKCMAVKVDIIPISSTELDAGSVILGDITNKEEFKALEKIVLKQDNISENAEKSKEPKAKKILLEQ